MESFAVFAFLWAVSVAIVAAWWMGRHGEITQADLPLLACGPLTLILMVIILWPTRE